MSTETIDKAEKLKEWRRQAIAAGQMFQVSDLMMMTGWTKFKISKLTNTSNESLRIPSIRIGRKPYFFADEFRHYLENHRFVPKRRRRS